MASSLFALLDDIATILDDVSLLTKVAAKKTAGVLGDDLALNAQQVSGVKADRELPVVWAVCKGSFINKAILVPAALAISAFVPWLITPLLMLGGLYLCYEGVEKLAHKLLHSKQEDAARRVELADSLANSDVDLVALEKDKIKGAIRTDFILSAEIIVIALGTVAHVSFGTRVAVMVGIAILMTVGVYGLVAGIVKLDDAGLYLSRLRESWKQSLGRALLWFAPWLMKFLSFAGTIAMFLVGGGILTHGYAAAHHLIEDASLSLSDWSEIPGVGAVLSSLAPMVINLVVGIVAGAIALIAVTLVKKALPSKASATN